MILWPSSSVGLKFEIYPSSFKIRAISSFKREAGTSTFWWRAWSALRTLVSMSATGSVNLIVCFSLSHPFAPHPAENLQRLVHQSFAVNRLALACSHVVANEPTTSDQR